MIEDNMRLEALDQLNMCVFQNQLFSHKTS